MIALIGTLVFAAALVASMMVLVTTLLPAWPRIVTMLRYGLDIGAPVPPQPEISLRRPSLRLMPMSVPASPQAWRAAA